MSTKINRRDFLKLGATGVLSAGMAMAGVKPWHSTFKAKSSRPNVLLIVMDTVRSDRMSIYGYQKQTSPNIQQIAKSGMVFSNAIARSSWTLPSHSSMFTAHTPTELGVDWLAPLNEKYPTLAEAFRDADYLTSGFIANYDYCSWEFGLDRGFEHYEDYRKNYEEILLSSSVLNKLAYNRQIYERYARHNNFGRKSAEQVRIDFLHWLDRQDPAQSFFTFLNFYDAHDPYIPPIEYVKQYAPDRPTGFIPRNEKIKLDQKTIHAASDAYDGAIGYIDDQIGSLMSELNNRGLLQNTLVIITSDHGEQFGEHGLMLHGNSLYRPLIHVPMILYYPDQIRSNQVMDKPVDMLNLAATIVELVNLNTPINFSGRSLLSNRSSMGEGEMIQSEFNHFYNQYEDITPGKWLSYIQDRWHYILSPDLAEELYDYVDDPQESINLVDEASMRDLLEKFRTAVGST